MFIGDDEKKKILELIWSFEFLSARDLIDEHREQRTEASETELIDYDILGGYSQFMQHSLKEGPECITQLHLAAKTFEDTSARSEKANYFKGYGWSQLLLGLCLFVEGVDKKESTNKLTLYQKARIIWDDCRNLLLDDDYFHLHRMLKEAMMVERCIEDNLEYHFELSWANLGELDTLVKESQNLLKKLTALFGSEDILYKDADMKFCYTNSRRMALMGEGFSKVRTEMNKAIELANALNATFFQASALMYLCVSIRKALEGLILVDNTDMRIMEFSNQFTDYASRCNYIVESHSLEAIRNRLKSERDRVRRMRSAI